MDWYKVVFSGDDVANQNALQDAFRGIFMINGSPADAALFEQIDGGAIFYFSPLAASLTRLQMATYGGVPCLPPDKNAVRLLIGNGDPRERLL